MALTDTFKHRAGDDKQRMKAKNSPGKGLYDDLQESADAVARESVVFLDRFHYGQRVRVTDKAGANAGQVGAIVEYDLLEDQWRVLMESGSGKLVSARNIEPVEVKSDSWVRYQAPGAEHTWAYFNMASQESRWDLPPNADPASVQELLPQTARAFMFYVGERWRSLTSAYGEICQVAAALRPRETASLTAGASLDREDFMAACEELMLVRDGNPEIAGLIFDEIDIDGRSDFILTIADFHAADRRFRSASNGAMGNVVAPAGLLMFNPELVPSTFKNRNAHQRPAPEVNLLRLVDEEEQWMRSQLLSVR